MNLPAIKTVKQEGTERFKVNSFESDLNVLSFWQWSTSDLLTNRQRGILAEFVVASALDLLDKPREDWDAYDLITNDGLKIEVKSASYIQSWEQKEFSKINFSIQPTVRWEGDKRTEERVRQSDVYIFCILDNKDTISINPLDLDQWTFYIVETKKLNDVLGTQKTLSLSKLKKLSPKVVKYLNIYEEIESLRKEVQ